MQKTWETRFCNTGTMPGRAARRSLGRLEDTSSLAACQRSRTSTSPYARLTSRDNEGEGERDTAGVGNALKDLPYTARVPARLTIGADADVAGEHTARSPPAHARAVGALRARRLFTEAKCMLPHYRRVLRYLRYVLA